MCVCICVKKYCFELFKSSERRLRNRVWNVTLSGCWFLPVHTSRVQPKANSIGCQTVGRLWHGKKSPAEKLPLPNAMTNNNNNIVFLCLFLFCLICLFSPLHPAITTCLFALNVFFSILLDYYFKTYVCICFARGVEENGGWLAFLLFVFTSGSNIETGNTRGNTFAAANSWVLFLFVQYLQIYTKRKKCLKTLLLLLQKYVANRKDGKYLLVAHRFFESSIWFVSVCVSVLRLLWCLHASLSRALARSLSVCMCL